jgi:ABC-type Fe3+/spermidine/putrescine transport system ATPase subunit
MTQVTLTGLTKHYPGAAAPALQDLSLLVPAGHLTALLGPSGCGKTTALQLIAGLIPPTAGSIAFDGAPVLHLPPERRGAVMMFQNHLLFPTMTVAENVGFGLRMRGHPRAEIASRVAEMLELVQLPDLGTRRPVELSGGQSQRVALARALIVRPRVLLLDEPLSSLDPHLRGEMRDLIRSIQRETAITTILVTHDQEEAVAMADSVALLLGGRLRQHDAPEAFYRRPADAGVVGFFGGVNLIPGRSVAGRFDSALGPLRLPDGAPAGPGLLTFRPEAVRLGPAAVNQLEAVVRARQFLGKETRLVFAAGDTAFQASVPPDQAQGLAPGDIATLHLPPASLWVVPPVAPGG